MLYRKRISALILLVITLFSVACASVGGNHFPLAKGYLRENELFGRLKAISQIDPALTRLRIIGFSSTESKPIYALDIGRPVSKRNILIIGQHHGDEVLGVELAVALAEELNAKGIKDKTWKRILDEFHFWIIPTINPEGFGVVSDGRYQWKRKNNRDTDKNGRLDLRTDGVDLNRNYPVFWGDDPPVPVSSPYFKGERPASEAEVRAVMQLAQTVPFELAIFYHSSASGAYSEKIYLPAFNAADEAQSRIIAATADFAKSYARLLPKDYGKGHYIVSEGNSTRMGTARNYFFHTHGTKAFLVELGGINPDGISVIHPPLPIKQKIVDKHLKALRKVLYQNID